MEAKMTREEHKALRIKQLAGWGASGLTQQAYCEREGISLKTFQRWRHRLAAQAGALPGSVQLVPVRVADTVSAVVARTRREPTDVLAQPVEVVLASGRRLRFGDGLEETALARLIRLLEVLPC
jgi:hypothetical protein